MQNKMTHKNRAIQKVIACIDSSTNIEHLVACKKMLSLIYNYGVKNKTLTYLTLKYKAKKQELYDE
tara:strand:+ start:272 stop:469 length:198 start_codon:yes stop_codon:yes gene_type:complete